MYYNFIHSVLLVKGVDKRAACLLKVDLASYQGLLKFKKVVAFGKCVFCKLPDKSKTATSALYVFGWNSSVLSAHFLALVSRAELISFSAGSAILLMSLAPNNKRLFLHVESHFDRSDVPINFFITKDFKQ